MCSRIINIGRQFGSGGKQIAANIGERLGIKVYDREILLQAAKGSGLSPEFFEDFDEKRRLWSLGNIFGTNSESFFSDAELFRVQSETIRRIAGAGDAIFVGRASNYALRDMRCLNVFVCAPEQIRAERVSAREGITPEEAREVIRKKDRARARFYNFFTFEEWGMASSYDLCLDSSVLGIEESASFIIDFGKKTGIL